MTDPGVDRVSAASTAGRKEEHLYTPVGLLHGRAHRVVVVEVAKRSKDSRTTKTDFVEGGLLPRLLTHV